MPPFLLPITIYAEFSELLDQDRHAFSLHLYFDLPSRRQI